MACADPPRTEVGGVGEAIGETGLVVPPRRPGTWRRLPDPAAATPVRANSARPPANAPWNCSLITGAARASTRLREVEVSSPQRSAAACPRRQAG